MYEVLAKWGRVTLKGLPTNHRPASHHVEAKQEITMHGKPVALVGGANQGIRLQIAKDLAAHAFAVLVGSRNLERGEAGAKEVGSDARALQLDVDWGDGGRPSKVGGGPVLRLRLRLGDLSILVDTRSHIAHHHEVSP